MKLVSTLHASSPNKCACKYIPKKVLHQVSQTISTVEHYFFQQHFVLSAAKDVSTNTSLLNVFAACKKVLSPFVQVLVRCRSSQSWGRTQKQPLKDSNGARRHPKNKQTVVENRFSWNVYQAFILSVDLYWLFSFCRERYERFFFLFFFFLLLFYSAVKGYRVAFSATKSMHGVLPIPEKCTKPQIWRWSIITQVIFLLFRFSLSQFDVSRPEWRHN